jgi:hypothetical protein
MPCTHVESPEEQAAAQKRAFAAETAALQEVERQNCFKRFGLRDTELGVATYVACKLSKGESDNIVKIWLRIHEEMDRRRAYVEAERKVAVELEAEVANYRRVRESELRVKHGLEN